MTEEAKTAQFPDTIDFNQTLLSMNGEPIMTKDDDEDIPMTLGNACCSALLASIRDDKADGTQKLNRFKLARKIQGSAEEVDWAVARLNSKQKRMILELAEKAWPTLIYARIHEALEGTVEEDEG